MGSKAIAFVGFFLTMFLLVTAQIAAARELTQISGAVGRELTDASTTVVHTSKKATDQFERPPEYPVDPPCRYSCTHY